MSSLLNRLLPRQADHRFARYIGFGILSVLTLGLLLSLIPARAGRSEV